MQIRFSSQWGNFDWCFICKLFQIFAIADPTFHLAVELASSLWLLNISLQGNCDWFKGESKSLNVSFIWFHCFRSNTSLDDLLLWIFSLILLHDRIRNVYISFLEAGLHARLLFHLLAEVQKFTFLVQLAALNELLYRLFKVFPFDPRLLWMELKHGVPYVFLGDYHGS